MRSHFLIAAISTLLSRAAMPVQACDHSRRDGGGAFQIGNDGPADPATLGYTLNHFSLLVNDMVATKQFYGEVLGMREIFTFHASSDYEIMYMGYSHGGKNGTGYQTGEELYAEKTNIEGLIEFLSLKNGPKLVSSTKSANTFSHVGLVVPDVQQTEARMKQFGVKVLKAVGEEIAPDSEAATAYGFGANLQEARAAGAGIEAIGFAKFLLVTDPDGNLVEVQNQS